MKTEKQVTDLFEARLIALEKLSNAVPNMTPEQKAEVVGLFHQILAFSIVLDCEEEMRPVLNQIRLAGVAAKLAT